MAEGGAGSRTRAGSDATHERKGPDVEDRSVERNSAAINVGFGAAADRNARNINIDTRRDDDLDASHARQGIQCDLGLRNLSSAKIKSDLTHEGDSSGIVVETPATTTGNLAQNGDARAHHVLSDGAGGGRERRAGRRG